MYVCVQVEQERRRQEEEALCVGRQKEQLEQTVRSLEQELSETHTETHSLKVKPLSHVHFLPWNVGRGCSAETLLAECNKCVNIHDITKTLHLKWAVLAA